MVYSTNGVSQTITAGTHGYGMGNILVVSCAIRGRYDENNKVKQHLEINTSDYANCITGVNKDSLLLEE